MSKILDYDFSALSVMPPDIISTLTTNRTLFDSAGLLVPAPHNFLGNSFLKDRIGDTPDGWTHVNDTGSIIWTDIEDYSQGVMTGTNQRKYFTKNVPNLTANTIYTILINIKESSITAGNGIILNAVSTGGTDVDITDADWDSLGGVAGWYAVALELGAQTNFSFGFGLGRNGNATGSVTMSRPGVVKGNITGTGALNTPALIDEPFLTQGGWVGTNDGSEPAYHPRLGSHVFESSSWINKGLGIAPPFTNICPQSETLGTTWDLSTGSVVLDANALVAPDGNMTMDTLEDDNGSNLDFGRIGISVADDTGTYCGSIYIPKTSSASHFPAIFMRFFGGTDSEHGVVLDTDNGTAVGIAGAAPAAGDFGVVDAGDRWRVWMLKTNTGDGSVTMLFTLMPAANTNAGTSLETSATGVTGFWGGQITKTSSLMPYSGATTTAAVAVSADINTQLTSTIANYNQSAISIFLSFYNSQLQSTGLRTIISLDDGGVTDRITLAIQSGSGGNDLEWASTHSADTDGSVINTDGIPSNTQIRSTLMFADDDFNSTLAGADVIQDISAALPLADNQTTLRFGHDSAGNYLNDILTEIEIYNTRISNSFGRVLAGGSPVRASIIGANMNGGML